MNSRSLLLITCLTLCACSSTSGSASHGTTSSALASSSRAMVDIYARTLANIKDGKEFIFDDEPIVDPPESVRMSQISGDYSVMRLGEMLFVTAFEHSSDLQTGRQSWVGIFARSDDDAPWESFVKIESHTGTSEPGTKLHNPFNLFIHEGALVLDVLEEDADEIMMGYAEGNMSRFQSIDGGKTWTDAGCYHFVPLQYYPDLYSNDYYLQPVHARPFDLEKTTGCVYTLPEQTEL